MEKSKLLYSHSSVPHSLFGSVQLGESGPSGLYLSSARTAGSRGNTAKINNGLLALDYLCTGALNAIKISDFVYVEFTVNGTKHRATADKSAIHFQGVLPSPEDRCVPITIYWLLEEKKKEKTRKTAKAIIDEFAAGAVTSAHCFQFCDEFYFENKDDIPDEVICDTDIMPDELLQQSIRTGNYQEIDLLQTAANLPALNLLRGVEREPDKTETKDKEQKFQSCRIGDHFVSYVWDPERQSHIPDLSILDEFVPNDAFFVMTDLMQFSFENVVERMNKGLFGPEAIQEDYINCQFIGRPGTGKTTVANALAAAFHLPIRVIVNSKNTEEDTYQGMTKVQEGSFQFVETPFLDVYKNGGILLLEEFNLTDPGVTMGALGQAIEQPFLLLEDGYREVHRHPLCIVVATMNTGTQGARLPSEALTSRMPHAFLLDDPDEQSFIQILLNKSKRSKQECKKVYGAYQKILKYLKSPSVNQEDAALSITLRHCLAALKQMSVGCTLKQAVYNTMIGTIAIKDMDLAKEVNESVIQTMPA